MSLGVSSRLFVFLKPVVLNIESYCYLKLDLRISDPIVVKSVQTAQG